MADSKSKSSKPDEEINNLWDVVQKIFNEIIDVASKYTPSGVTNRKGVGIFLWLVIPLALGIWFAQNAVPTPAVGIIRLNTGISMRTSEFTYAQIEAARNTPGIEAVVLQIDTPGGGVVATQYLYYELQDFCM